MKFNEWNSEEIEVNPAKDFKIDELDYTDKHLTDSPLVHNAELPYIKLINKSNIGKVVSLSIDKYCENYGKNARRKSFWINKNFYVNK